MKICSYTMSTKLKNLGKYLYQTKCKLKNQVKNYAKFRGRWRGSTVNKCTLLY
jgi:hypothetical protein